jgi:hypothetical protein
MVSISSTICVGWHTGLRVGTWDRSSITYSVATTVIVRVYGTHLQTSLLAKISEGVKSDIQCGSAEFED